MSSDQAVNFTAAGLATFTSRIALHPLDTLRTLAQRPPTSTRRAVSLLSLWSGFPAAALGSVPAQSLYYTAYSSLKPVLGVAPAAALANVAAAVIRVPAELLKQRAQTGGGGARAILRADGLRGLWRGYPAQVIRDVPYAIALFAVYEGMNKRGYGRRGLVTGAIAGTFASLVTSPMDLMKTRSMLAQGSAPEVGLMKILRTEGGAVLWKGAGYRVLYKCCSSALFFGALEVYKRFFFRVAARRQEERRERRSKRV